MKKKPKLRFVQISLFLKGKDHSKNMAEKQSPQDENAPKFSPEDAADKIVKTRKAMKRGKLPAKAGNLYDEL